MFFAAGDFFAHRLWDDGQGDQLCMSVLQTGTGRLALVFKYQDVLDDRFALKLKLFHGMLPDY